MHAFVMLPNVKTPAESTRPELHNHLTRGRSGFALWGFSYLVISFLCRFSDFLACNSRRWENSHMVIILVWPNLKYKRIACIFLLIMVKLEILLSHILVHLYTTKQNNANGGWQTTNRTKWGKMYVPVNHGHFLAIGWAWVTQKVKSNRENLREGGLTPLLIPFTYKGLQGN